MAFKEKLAQLRRDSGMTQAEVAAALNPPYTAQAVHKWEANGNIPKMPALKQLSELFGVSVGELLDEDQMPGGAVRPVPSSAYVPVLSLGRVHAGEPMEAIEDAAVVEVPKEVVDRHPRAFLLEVEGDCMDLVYPEGCMVLVDPDMMEWNGCAVVAEHHGETVLREYHMFTDTLILSARSTRRHPDIVVSGDDEVRKIGVVCWFQAKEDMR